MRQKNALSEHSGGSTGYWSVPALCLTAYWSTPFRESGSGISVPRATVPIPPNDTHCRPRPLHWNAPHPTWLPDTGFMHRDIGHGVLVSQLVTHVHMGCGSCSQYSSGHSSWSSGHGYPLLLSFSLQTHRRLVDYINHKKTQGGSDLYPPGSGSCNRN